MSTIFQCAGGRSGPVAGILLVGLLGLAAPLRSGEISGKVEISRALTKRRVMVPGYSIRGPVMPAKPKPAVDITQNELQRVAIYLEPAIATGMPSSTPQHLEIGQRSQRFSSELLIIPTGSTISFPNYDPIFHNVFSLSKARTFDLGFYPAGETREVKFNQPGVVQVFCHLHPDMSSAVVIAPSPWYGRPDAEGNFSFTDLPAGEYRVVVWHRSAGYFIRKVRLNETDSLNLDFRIPIKELPE
jgi:plastocyanin